MRHPFQRIAVSLFLSIGTFGVIAAAGLAFDRDLAPTAILGAAGAFLVYWLAAAIADLDAQRGQAEQEWRQAERIWSLELKEQRDIDQDGYVGRPPDRVWIRQWTARNRAAGLEREQLRAVLEWCYERQSQGLGWGQVDGRVAFGDVYDRAMSDLVMLGIVEGRRQGAMGELAVDRDTALYIFDNNWTPEYVNTARRSG